MIWIEQNLALLAFLHVSVRVARARAAMTRAQHARTAGIAPFQIPC